MKRFVLPILLAAALPGTDFRIMPAMNAFTTDSYKQLTRGDANLILSAFNIATALSMAVQSKNSCGAGCNTSIGHRVMLDFLPNGDS
jgi:serine protease inhibitor